MSNTKNLISELNNFIESGKSTTDALADFVANNKDIPEEHKSQLNDELKKASADINKSSEMLSKIMKKI